MFLAGFFAGFLVTAALSAIGFVALVLHVGPKLAHERMRYRVAYGVLSGRPRAG